VLTDRLIANLCFSAIHVLTSQLNKDRGRALFSARSAGQREPPRRRAGSLREIGYGAAEVAGLKAGDADRFDVELKASARLSGVIDWT
jgi:hypothetical protein